MIPHGCAGSPTTEIALKLPASIRAAWPAPAPGWQLEWTTTGDQADQGGETAPRIDIVRWWDGDLPDGELGELRIRLALPDEPGTVLAIPAVQTCADGETRWIQVPAAGERPDDLAEPAPTITLTAAAGDAAAAPADDGDRSGLVLGAAALAVALGAVALVVASRPSTRSGTDQSNRSRGRSGSACTAAGGSEPVQCARWSWNTALAPSPTRTHSGVAAAPSSGASGWRSAFSATAGEARFSQVPSSSRRRYGSPP
ncbi:MAG: YcnI family protein [Actinomycetota bacterium]